MRFERLITTEDVIYSRAMELYHSSFPFHEQREADSQAKIMNHREYQFLLIYDEDKFVGLLLCWENETFIYVEHFCILPAMRNKRYGQRALELLNQRGKIVILEIDPPVDEISARRKSFYERAGFRMNIYEHYHPAYHKGHSDHCLVVMSSPNELTKETYDEFAYYLRNIVMAI